MAQLRLFSYAEITYHDNTERNTLFRAWFGKSVHACTRASTIINTNLTVACSAGYTRVSCKVEIDRPR
jgi:hypothetical protein